MATERTYIVPLRREWIKVSRHKRAKKAVTGLKAFLIRHMKSDDIKIGEHLNKELWKNGMRNPPHKVKITVVKEDDGIVKAELFGQKYTAKKKAVKKEEPAGIAGKLQKALGTKGEKEEKEEETPGMAGKLKKMMGPDKKEKEVEAEIVEEKKPEHKEAKKETHKPAEKKPAKK